MIRGQVLYVDRREVWLAHGNRLFVSTDEGQTWCYRAVLPRKRLRDYLSLTRLGARFGRVGFHHLRKQGMDELVAIGNRSVWSFCQGEERLRELTRIVGSRPLMMETDERCVYFGEYRGNPERSDIHVWRVDCATGRTEPIAKFDNVRHIHGVSWDECSGGYWVTTGDCDDESYLWWADQGFRAVERVAGGSQRFRVVQPLFTDDYIYFGSDAPDENNRIYRMSRSSLAVETLADVGGPVFFGCKVDEALFFSTAVEHGGSAGYAEIWGSRGGDLWRCVQKYKKDWLPLKYFQYGQIRFPGGAGDDENLWFSPMATNGDGYTFKVSVSGLEI